MGSKIKFLAAICLLLLLGFSAPQANADNNVVRVGLTDNKFQNVLKQEVTIYGTAECSICDRESRKVISKINPNTDMTIKTGTPGLDVSIEGKGATLRDFVVICPQGYLGV